MNRKISIGVPILCVCVTAMLWIVNSRKRIELEPTDVPLIQLMIQKEEYKIVLNGQSDPTEASLVDFRMRHNNANVSISYGSQARISDLVLPLTKLGAVGLGNFRFANSGESADFFLPGLLSSTMASRMGSPTAVHDFKAVIILETRIQKFDKIVIDEDVSLSVLDQFLKLAKVPVQLRWKDGPLTLLSGTAEEWCK